LKITFPHMGNSHIAIKALLTGLKLEVILPPPITKRTLELGVKYSPEFACLPLKINVGNFIEALEQGADTVLMAGGWDPADLATMLRLKGIYCRTWAILSVWWFWRRLISSCRNC